jgi:hypothetical protein
LKSAIRPRAKARISPASGFAPGRTTITAPTFFAHHLVGHADHRRFVHGGMRGKGALHFHAIDDLAAGGG